MGLASPANSMRFEESAGQVETCVGVFGTLTLPVTATIRTLAVTAQGTIYNTLSKWSFQIMPKMKYTIMTMAL